MLICKIKFIKLNVMNMKSLLLLVFILVLKNYSFSQSTYFWVGGYNSGSTVQNNTNGTGAWNNSLNWRLFDATTSSYVSTPLATPIPTSEVHVVIDAVVASTFSQVFSASTLITLNSGTAEALSFTVNSNCPNGLGMQTSSGSQALKTYRNFVLDNNMNLSNFTGIFEFATKSTGFANVAGSTVTIDFKSNSLNPNSIYFNGSTVGVNFSVLGSLNLGSSTNAFINLLSSTNTCTFSGDYIQPSGGGSRRLLIAKGTLNVLGTFNMPSSALVVHVGGILKCSNGGTALAMLGRGQFLLNDSNNPNPVYNVAYIQESSGQTLNPVLTTVSVGSVTMDNTYFNGILPSPALPATINFQGCTLNVSYGWYWGSNTSSYAVVANNSNLVFTCTSPVSGVERHVFTPCSFVFDNVTINSGVSNFPFFMDWGSTIQTGVTISPTFNNLVCNNSVTFTRWSNPMNSTLLNTGPIRPIIFNTLTFSAGRSYKFFSALGNSFFSIEQSTEIFETSLGSAFRFSMKDGSTLNWNATCGNRIAIQRIAVENESGTSAGFSSNINNVDFFGAYAFQNNSNLALSPLLVPNNSVLMGGYTSIGVNIVSIPRTLVWVAPTPSVPNLLNNASYGIWENSSSWRDLAIDPAAISGPGYPIGSPACPPTSIDSVIFPSGSYVAVNGSVQRCKGMNWLGTGRFSTLIAGNSRLEVFGSLTFSSSMGPNGNDYQGTVWFCSTTPGVDYMITTNGVSFNRGVAFSSQNDQGLWTLGSNLVINPSYSDPNLCGTSVATFDSNWGTSANTGSTSQTIIVNLRIYSGRLRTGSASFGSTDCTLGNGFSIDCFGIYGDALGELHLYNSVVSVHGGLNNLFSMAGATANALCYNLDPSFVLRSGSSHMRFLANGAVGSLVSNSYQNIKLNKEHIYNKITLGRSVVGQMSYSNSNVRTHCLQIFGNSSNIAVGQAVRIAELTVEPQMRVRLSTNAVGSAGFGNPDVLAAYIGTAVFQTTELTNIGENFANRNVQKSWIWFNNLTLNGDVNCSNSIGIKNSATLSVNNFTGVFTSSSGGIANNPRINFSSDLSSQSPNIFASFVSSSCNPGGAFSYVGSYNLTGAVSLTCTAITVSNINFLNNTSNLVNVVNGSFINAPISGSSLGIISGSAFLSSSPGWTGTPSVPRKLRWVSGSSSSADWTDPNRWEQLLPNYQAAPNCPPISVDTVVFDGASSFTVNNQVINLNVLSAEIASMYWDNISTIQNPTLLSGSGVPFTLNGNLRLTPNMNFDLGGEFIFKGNGPNVGLGITTYTIETANKHFKNRVYFNATVNSMEWHLVDSLKAYFINTMTNNTSQAAGIGHSGIEFYRGRLFTNGNTIHVPYAGIRIIQDPLSGVSSMRHLDFSNSTINVLRGGFIAGTSNASDNLNTTLNSMGSQINMRGWEFNGGGKSYNTVTVGYDGTNVISPSAQNLFAVRTGDYFNQIILNNVTPSNISFNVNTANSTLFSLAPGVSSFVGVIANQITANTNRVIFDVNGMQINNLLLNTPGWSANSLISKSFKINNSFQILPGRTLQWESTGSSKVLWLGNACDVSIVGTNSSNLGVYLTNGGTGLKGYLRKDSALVCGRFLGVTGIDAIGNGSVGFGTGLFSNPPSVPCLTGNYSCTPSLDFGSFPCDTVINTSDNICGPSYATSQRGRAIFSSGTEISVVNSKGWASVPTSGAISLVLTNSNQTICAGQPVTLNFTGDAPLPFKIYYLVNGVQYDTLLSSTSQFVSYNTNPVSPNFESFIFQMPLYLPSAVSGSIISVSTLSINVFSCGVAGGGVVPATGSMNVTIYDPSSAPTSISGIGNYCNGNSVNLSAVGGTLTSGANYEWFANSCGGTVIGTGSSITVSPTTTTDYYVRVSAFGGCPATLCASGTVSLTPPINALSGNNETTSCLVNGSNWIHFYHSSGRLIGSLNPNGQNLGNVTMTSYVDVVNQTMPSCTDLTNPLFMTSVMQRHWVITPTIQPTSTVAVRLPFYNTEYSTLQTVAGANSNLYDNISVIGDVKLSKYHGPLNVDDTVLNDCPVYGGNGGIVLYAQSSIGAGGVNGNVSTGNGYPAAITGGRYTTYNGINNFSEFWLHGSILDVPLPIELIDFKTVCKNNSLVVSWSTATESNTAMFNVELSADGLEWHNMVSVDAAGNSASRINYEKVIELNDQMEYAYVRLSQVDINGTTAFYSPQSFECRSNLTNQLFLYPNPANEEINVSFYSSQTRGFSELYITDLLGKKVYVANVEVKDGDNLYTIEKIGLSNGMYVIHLVAGENMSEIYSENLIIVRD